MSSSKQQNSINIGAWAMSYQNTILDQMLQMFPRFQFQQLTKDTDAEHHSCGFSSWNYFVSMLFGQLAGQARQFAKYRSRVDNPGKIVIPSWNEAYIMLNT
jgi:hypothetical protein